MHTGIRMLASLLLALACAQVAHAADTPARKTVLDYLIQMQSEVMVPIIEHCARAVPATRADLEKEFGVFKEKQKFATQPLMRRIDQAGLPDPTSDEVSQVQQMVKALSAAQLNDVRKQDPAMYCPSLVAKMHAVTVEDLRTSIELIYDQYTAATDKAGK